MKMEKRNTLKYIGFDMGGSPLCPCVCVHFAKKKTMASYTNGIG